MTRKTDLPVTNRDIYFTPAGDDLWAGQSPETAVTTPEEALVRIAALDPPSGLFNPSSIVASQTSLSSSGISIPTGTSTDCRLASIITTDAITIECVGNAQLNEWALVFNRADAGVGISIDGRFGITNIVTVLSVGNDDPNTNNSIGLEIKGICDDIFAEFRQVTLRGVGDMAIKHTATSTTPIEYNINSAEFFNQNQTLIHMDAAATEQIEVSLVSVMEADDATQPTTNSCALDVRSGQMNARANALQAQDIIRVGAGGQLNFSALSCLGDATIETGGICVLNAGLWTGDIVVESGAFLTAFIQDHDGTITNNGTLDGIINGKCFGIFCASFGNMFQRDNAVVTTINTIDVWEDVANFTEGETNRISFASSTLTTEDVSEPYLIQYDACIDDTTNKTYEMAIEIDGVIQDESLSCTTIPTGGNPDGLGGSFIKTVATAKDIKLVIRNITDANNVTVVHASVTITRI